jgi:hypothetical protein
VDADESLMATTPIVVLLPLLFVAGCACTADRVQPGPAAVVPGPPPVAATSEPEVTPSEQIASPPAAIDEVQGRAVPVQPATPKLEHEAVVKPPPVAESQSMAAPKPAAPQARTAPAGASAPKAEPPAVKPTAAAKVAAASAPTEQGQKKETPVPGISKPAPPPLDVKSLENRLRETPAIGVMTKLTLKSQVDDLLDRFRAYHEGRARIQLAELRQPYDTLILKVLALLQDKDPSLANAIAASREAIWGILADQARFSNL